MDQVYSMIIRIGSFASGTLFPYRHVHLLCGPQLQKYGSLMVCMWCSHVDLLRNNREIWMNGTYKLICGFAITRDLADQLIGGMPEGTFILRPSIALEGTFVISLIRDGHPHHLALDAMQLQQRSLLVSPNTCP